MIILRDDDCNFFTDVSILKNFISLIPDKVSIVIGIVPFIKPSVCGCVPPYLWGQSKKVFRLTKNKALCKALKDFVNQGKIIPAMHGINHLYSSNLFGKLQPEFYNKSFSSEIIEHGKKEMEIATGIIPNIFIPPSNKINPLNYLLISKHFDYIFNIPSIASISRPFDLKHIKRWCKRIIKYPNLLSDSPKKIKDLTEISSFDFNPYSINQLPTDLLQTIGSHNHNIIGIASHYWEIINEDSTNAESYKNLLNLLLEKGVIFANKDYFLS